MNNTGVSNIFFCYKYETCFIKSTQSSFKICQDEIFYHLLGIDDVFDSSKFLIRNQILRNDFFSSNFIGSVATDAILLLNVVYQTISNNGYVVTGVMRHC